MNLLIVDDEPSFVRQLARILEADLRARVDTTHCGATAMEMLLSQSYATAILDRCLPDGGPTGIELCRLARDTLPAVGLIVVSGSDGRETVLEAFAAGADDFITKPVDPNELVARVRALTRRCSASWRAPNMVVGNVARATSELSQCEARLLQYLQESDRGWVSAAALAEAVLGRRDPGGPHAVRQHVMNLRLKLERSGFAGFLLSDRSRGYRIMASAELSGERALVAPGRPKKLIQN